MHRRLTRPDAELSADLLAQSRAELAAPADEWRSPRPNGWTLPEMKRAARLGSARIRYGAWRLLGDAIDVAWEGAALAIAEDPHASWAVVAEAASRAVGAEASAVQHAHRLSQSDAHTGARSAIYWGDWLDDTPPSPEGCLDRMALAQVWAALPEVHREILALAAVLPSSEVADRLGISPARVSQRLTIARRAAITLWHDWEPPPTHLPRARVPRDGLDTCPQGHPLTATRQAGGWTHRRCRTCDAARHRKASA